VWFGEQLDPLNLEAAFDWAGRCDLMLVAGTSAIVYPAAAVPYEAKRKGATVVEINPYHTELTRYCDFAIAAPSGEVLPALWQRVQGLSGAVG
jgi:NAD-dependent deacetylase